MTKKYTANVTMEQLAESEKELSELIARKRQIDKNLANIEVSIYALEGAYLEETTAGNLVKGFDGFVARTDKRRSRVTEEDRIFSTSSMTYYKALEMRSRDDGDSRSARKKRI